MVPLLPVCSSWIGVVCYRIQRIQDDGETFSARLGIKIPFSPDNRARHSWSLWR